MAIEPKKPSRKRGARKVKHGTIFVANNIIETYTLNFTLTQQKILYLVGMILNSEFLTNQRVDEVGFEDMTITEQQLHKLHSVRFTFKEAEEITGHSVQHIEEALLQMSKITMRYRANGWKTAFQLFTRSQVSDDRQEIRLFFVEEMFRFFQFLGKKNPYHKSDSPTLMSFDSIYTFKMYEYLEKFQNAEVTTSEMTLQALNTLFGTKYKRLSNIYQSVVSVAQTELDRKSKLTFRYENITQPNLKGGRAKVTGCRIYTVGRSAVQAGLFDECHEAIDC